MAPTANKLALMCGTAKTKEDCGLTIGCSWVGGTCLLTSAVSDKGDSGIKIGPEYGSGGIGIWSYFWSQFIISLFFYLLDKVLPIIINYCKENYERCRKRETPQQELRRLEGEVLRIQQRIRQLRRGQPEEVEMRPLIELQ